MSLRKSVWAKILGAVSLWLALAFAAQPPDAPPVPVGVDAYRAWDQWPQQRIGMRAYMRSTYDRRGGNEGVDASHFLNQLGDDFNVTSSPNPAQTFSPQRALHLRQAQKRPAEKYELRVGSQFQNYLGSDISQPLSDGGRVTKLNDVRVLPVDPEAPISARSEDFYTPCIQGD